MATRELTERQQKFVSEYLKDENGTRAAKVAGYPENGAAQQAHRLLKKTPVVIDAIAQAKKDFSTKHEYTLDKAMKEAEAAIEFAIQTKNANAYVKAVELRTKLNGLLVEKHDVRQVGFNIVIKGVNGGGGA
jgi:phage terminase small subunit